MSGGIATAQGGPKRQHCQLMKGELVMAHATLTGTLLVQLPGIETDALPGFFRPELQFRYVPFRFSPARNLRYRFRVLTASTATWAQRIGATNIADPISRKLSALHVT